MILESYNSEQTLPDGASQNDTYKMLEMIAESSNISDGEEIRWFAGGKGNDKLQHQRQMRQHMEAYYFLDRHNNINYNIVLEAHGILMKDATYEDAESLRHIIDTYNNSSKDEVVVAPTLFCYEILTLHPFENGNGRLARLLLTWALRQAGVPFPIPLSSGHRKSRSHYMRAILRARIGALQEFNTLTLLSVLRVVANYTEKYRILHS
ncbi:hypothetical protein SeLEV6574_g00271 [Synchytrium endobioticum]|uniref:Fido domain-containing protein n=1 Tax=Synchytrium endobioticum TaxID=286115 RepID=A0A507DIN7_9FUNG|nr:hypothetical protein SeLEV6574_g00271 [Synchytrium endobioticum]